jgi:hypothetical protein
MAFTYSEQIRKVTLPLAAPLYEIVMQVTDAGDLPDAGVFVMAANIPEDPKSDTLARVATIADMEALVLDRPTALLENAEGITPYYRSAQLTVRYDSLTTAVAAKDVLKSRVDELVSDWQTYLGKFVADGLVHSGTLYPIDITEHPRYNQDAYSLLVKAYVDALATEADAKTTLDEAAADYKTATDAATAATADVTAKQGVYDACVAASASVEAFIAAAAAYRAATPVKDTPAGAESAFVPWFSPPLRPDCSAFCAARLADLSAAQAAKATADTAVATARTAYENAKAAYANAQTATEMALAAVRTLKPSFNPSTDIPAGL